MRFHLREILKISWVLKMSNYISVKVRISESQKDKLKKAFESNCKSITIRLTFSDLHGEDVISVTKSQVDRLVEAYEEKKGMTIKLSKTQLFFSNQKFSRMYGDAALFGVKCFGMHELIIQSKITPSGYKTLYPLFTFDVSKQKESLKSSVVGFPNKGKFHWKCYRQHKSICTGYFRKDVVILVWR